MLVEAEIWSIARIGQDNAVLVRPVGSNKAVPIYIDKFQTQSILIGLGKVPLPRPLTHDLLIGMLEELDVAIERIEITSLKDSTYYAQIILNRNGEEVTVDSRPSDAFALAVRNKCSIFISEDVVEEAASEISEITGETVDDLSQPAENEDIDIKDDLEEKLRLAIEEENYEQAAVLRDKLQELGNS